MKGFILLFWISLMDPPKASSYSWYSTIWEMQNLTAQDRVMVKDLGLRLKTGKEAIDKQISQIETMKENVINFLYHFDKTSNFFQLYEHFAWLAMQMKILKQRSSFPISSGVSKAYKKAMKTFPKSSDKKVVLQTLLDIQKFNKLSARDISRGYIMDSYSGNKLSPKSVYELTTLVCQNYPVERCHEWSEEALRNVDHADGAYELQDIEALIRFARDKREYYKLCALSVNQSYIANPSDSSLKCFVWNNHRHPWLVLQPVRAELMASQPPIIVFYDVISDAEISYLRNRSLPELNKAQTFDKETKIEIDSYRVAHNCWLRNLKDGIVRKLDRRVAAITGLRHGFSSEHLQIANYGIGGHYNTHMDGIMHGTKEEEIKTLNRKATFMFYLSDVKRGGATVFTYPKIAVKPKKRAAVFWYNLLPSGEEIDFKSMHGGCPVVLGNKWVANRWIWETRKETCKEVEYV